VPELPTFADLYDDGKAEVQARQPELSDWNEGSNLDAVIGGGAMLADEVLRVVVALFGEHFIDVAEDTALDVLALDRFGLTRLPASASVGTLRFTRGSSTGVLTIPAGTQVRGEVNGVSVTVTTDTDTDMAALDNTVDVDATCTVTGRSGNVAEEVLDEIVDTIPGDSTVTVTNPDRFTGGDVDETDPEFRDRIRRYFQTLRKGTVAALEAGALSVPGVQYATVDETFIAPEDGGYVAVYIGDPDGRANSVLTDDVEEELEDWRAAGIEVRVFAATREEIALSITVYHRRGIDVAELTAAVRAGVLAHTDALAPNATLYLEAVECAAQMADKASIRAARVTSHTADVEPSAPQNAIRVNSEDLTIALVEVA
jgi:uncharacterized phage protein gp47/JayE